LEILNFEKSKNVNMPKNTFSNSFPNFQFQFNLTKFSRISLGIFIILLIFYVIILGFAVTNFGSSDSFSQNPELNPELNSKKFDTAIVLGAGLIESQVSPVLAARIDHTLNLYKQNQVKTIIFTGGIGANQNISEGEASFNYATEKLSKMTENSFKNIFDKSPEKNQKQPKLTNPILNPTPNSVINSTPNSRNFLKTELFFETVSKTTKQNLQEAAQIMKQNSLKNAVIISDPLHLFRANLIAKQLKLEIETSPTPFSRYLSFNSKLGFLIRELWFCQVFWLTGN